MLMMAISGSLMGFLCPFGETNASHGLRCPAPSFLTVGGDTPEKPDSQVDGTHHLHFTGGSIGIAAAGAAGLALTGAVTRRTTSTVTRETGSETTLRRLMPVVLILILVCQKCCADALTWLSKAKMHMVYSGSNVTLVSEVLKFPVLLFAVAIFSSPKDVVPTIKAAVTESPWKLWWVGLLYAVQNLLYFVCLQYTSAAAYQVLSQTKTIFTAAFMWQLMGRKFTMTQLTALLMLVAGTVFTQLAEIQGPVSAGSRPWLGASLAVLSALLSALPNVFYERLLKEDKSNEWRSNLQLTTWICAWVAIIKGCGFMIAGGGGHGVPSLAALFDGFAPVVWVIVALKTMNCVIVPACLKYADNILYGYAKPTSIVLTVIVTSLATMSLPSQKMMIGIALVTTSIVTYGRA